MKTISNVQELNIREGSKILVILPHPDDESVFCAGLISKLTSFGAKVRVISLTQGEASTLVYGLKEQESLAVKRSIELANALKVLGVKNYKIAKFPDGGLDKVRSKVYNYCKKEILNNKPEMVVAFEPDGVYGHIDHITNSEIVTKIHNENRKKFRLLYATVIGYLPSKGVIHMSAKPQLKNIEPNIIIKLNIKESWLKAKAVLSHYTQFGGQKFKIFYHFFSKGRMSREYFHEVK